MCQHTCTENALTGVNKLNALWTKFALSFPFKSELHYNTDFSVSTLLLNSEVFFIVYMNCICILHLLSQAQIPAIIHNQSKSKVWDSSAWKEVWVTCMPPILHNSSTLDYCANTSPIKPERRYHQGRTFFFQVIYSRMPIPVPKTSFQLLLPTEMFSCAF